VARSQFLRAKRLSSDADARKKSDEMVRKQLLFNHYPNHVIEEARRTVERPARKQHQSPYTAFLKLPYKSDAVHRRIQTLVKKHKYPVRIVYEHVGSLRRVLSRSALAPPECKRQPTLNKPRQRGRPKGPCVCCTSGASKGLCRRKDVVYQMHCKVCGEPYIGETERELEVRTREHNGEARNEADGKPWGEHWRAHHSDNHVTLSLGDTAFSRMSVLAVESDRARRKIREAIEIRDRAPTVNVNNGWDLIWRDSERLVTRRVVSCVYVCLIFSLFDIAWYVLAHSLIPKGLNLPFCHGHFSHFFLFFCVGC